MTEQAESCGNDVTVAMHKAVSRTQSWHSGMNADIQTRLNHTQVTAPRHVALQRWPRQLF